MGEEKELTFGQKAVGLTFNPSNDPVVDAIKAAFAHAIDLCNDQRNIVGQSESGRLLSKAITDAQSAQMFAVKGVTWRD